ncbi:hypothetical protein BJ165DRAFT_1485908 [Panaeolus papilionaceus]|nr:hypothetical protein BJ165DRAFT_1485908 [Panaeolus papilionaceus]
MATLFTRLSPELLNEVFENLVDHHPSLWSLCLVGNHTILSIAQKLFWREIHWRWNAALLDSRNGDTERCKLYQQQLVDYCSSEERVKAARYLDLEVWGGFSGDYSHDFFEILEEELPKFVNVTHLCISFSGVAVDDPSAQNVGVILHKLPALVSLRLEGCKSQGKDFEARITLPDLECLQLWHCDGDYTSFARDAPNLRVVEFVGGDGEKYWRNERNGVGKFGGYNGAYSTFSCHRMRQKAEPELDSDDEDADEDEEPPMAMKTLTRLAVRCDCTKKCWDAMDIVRYVETAIPHPDLEELIIHTPISEANYRSIIEYLIAPSLEVLYVSICAETLPFDDPRTADTAQVSFGEFPSLSELWLPCKGLDVGIVFEHFTLQENTELVALCFNENDYPNVDYADLALQYAQHLPKLRFVSWKDQKFCRIKREEDGRTNIESQDWVEPPWLKFRGIGPWWD